MMKNQLYNMLYQEILDMLGDQENINLHRLDMLIKRHNILSIYKAILKSNLLTHNEKALLEMFQVTSHQEQKEIIHYFRTYGFTAILHNPQTPPLTIIEQEGLHAFQALSESEKIEALHYLYKIKKIK